jgi:hypothetical protein
MEHAMNDNEIFGHIEQLVAEEHRLLEKGDAGTMGEHERTRLGEINVQLDRYYDLLRQRRAKRDAGEDPESAHMRSPKTVEGYLQ